MFSHTSQHTELHKTILRGEEQTTLQRCEDCCSLYHCPFCGPEMFKPTIKSKCLKHLQGHRRRAIRHKEFLIFKCHLKCRTAPHFHCISCTSTFMRKDGFLKHLAMCENKKPKIAVVELKSEENSPAPDLHQTASEAGSTEEMPVNNGHKSLISEDAQKIRRKANFEQYLCPKMAVSERTLSLGMADQGSTGEGGVMEEQERTVEPRSSVVEGDPSVVDHHITETTVSNSDANPHPIEADLAIQTLVNEMFTGHTPVESTIPQRSRSDAQDLCPFCGLMLHRKNLQVHLRRKHPDQVPNQEKPAHAQVKNPKQQRLPLRKQQKNTEPSRVCLETCDLKPANVPSSHSISTVSATCDLIPKSLTNPCLPRASTCPPVASTSGSSIVSATCKVDRSASEMEHFSSTLLTQSSLTGLNTALLRPTVAMPSEVQNVVFANPTERIYTSNKKCLSVGRSEQ